MNRCLLTFLSLTLVFAVPFPTCGQNIQKQSNPEIDERIFVEMSGELAKLFHSKIANKTIQSQRKRRIQTTGVILEIDNQKCTVKIEMRSGNRLIEAIIVTDLNSINKYQDLLELHELRADQLSGVTIRTWQLIDEHSAK